MPNLLVPSLNEAALAATAQALAQPAKGLLAIDESPPTMGSRLAPLGVANTPATRLAWREALLDDSASLLRASISGVILHNETLRATLSSGKSVPEAIAAQGSLPGIKADGGTRPLVGKETITEGLDGLAERMKAWADLGARFAKWRATLSLLAGGPSPWCVRANAEALARYAACAQAAGLVPIVEPEILMDGDHDLARAEAAHERVLTALFAALRHAGVLLEGVILKPAMATSGVDAKPDDDDAIAAATLRVLTRCVPACVPGIAFLSGGQTEAESTRRLDAINRHANARPHGAPWTLTFSYGRALQASALKVWRGEAAKVAEAQKCFAHRARMNALAATGGWSQAAENAAA